MNENELEEVVSGFGQLGTEGCESLLKDWHFWRHPYQDWNAGENATTTFVAGRGAGKNYVGGNACHDIAKDWQPDSDRRITVNGAECWERDKYNGHMVLVGRTETDVYDAMVYGESGIMETADPDFRPVYNRQTLSVTWPNGFVGHLRTGKNPDKIRSLNCCFAWMDEFAFFQYVDRTWINTRFSVRRGMAPEILITTSPLPLDRLIKIMNMKDNRIMTGSTFDNADNLNPEVLRLLREEFEGTDVGDQELHGKIIQLKSWALWRTEHIRRMELEDLPPLEEIVIGIDPSGGTANKVSAETGIIPVGKDRANNHYVLGDESTKLGSELWGDIAVNLGLRLVHLAPVRIVGESNYGGDMVVTTIRLSDTFRNLHGVEIEVELVRAAVSKGERAEVPAQRYKKGRVYHVGNPRNYTKLEHQMTTFDPRKARKEQTSPDRMDALVHAQWALIGDGLAEDLGLHGWAKAMAAMRKRVK